MSLGFNLSQTGNASEAGAGVVKLATQAQVSEGNATDGGVPLAIGPANLLGANNINGLNAGEDIVQGDAVMIGTGTDVGSQALIIDGAQDATFTVSSSNWAAQKVNFKAIRNISAIAFKHNLAVGNWVVSIRETITGPDLATGSFLNNSSGGSLIFRTIALSSVLDVEPDTDYYIVFRITSNSLTIYGQSTDIYSGGEAYTSADGGVTWGLASGVADFHVIVYGGITDAGLIYKANISLPNLFVGFADETALSGAACPINPQILVRKGIADLTPGSLYYLSNTPGELSPSGTQLVGLASKATELVRVWVKN